jgi:hypothetical protein
VTNGTHRCTEATVRGRLRKANEFLDAAESLRQHAPHEDHVGDAYVTLCIHAGIAAADVLCCTALGVHARGDDHTRAVNLLRSVRPDGRTLATALDVLLGMKTRAGYGHDPVSADQRSRAGRRARQLVEAAKLRATS